MASSGGNRGTFSLTGADAAFGSRSKDIFACLETIEAKHTAFESTPTARRESAALMKPDPGEEEATSAGSSDDRSFRAPIAPPRKKVRSNNVPGFQANPSRWTMYDLSDVADGQMSEKSNRDAAAEFMLQTKRKAADSSENSSLDDREDTTAPARHVFRKPVRHVADDTATGGIGGAPQASSARRLRALAEEREDDVDSDEDVAAGGRNASDGRQKNGGGIGDQRRDERSSAFNHSKSNQRGRQVRRRGADSDEDESDECAVVTTGSKAAAAATEDSDSDDFSELAAAESESNDDDRQSDGEQCSISDVGVVTGVVDSQTSAENPESKELLDGVD